MSLSSTVVGVVGVFLSGVGVFVVAGDMVAADHGASFEFSLFLFLFDFCLLEGGPSDVTLQLRASEGPPEGRAALRPDSCCFDVDGTGIGGIAEWVAEENSGIEVGSTGEPRSREGAALYA
jgi:hypothetical protein